MQQRGVRAAMDTEAELCVPTARAQLVEYRFDEPPQSVLHIEDTIRIELCLTERHRSARASFVDLWPSRRFERIGDIFVVPPMVRTRVRADECAPIRSVVCHLDLAPLLAMFERTPVVTEQLLLASLDVQNTTVRALLLRLAEEIRHPGFAAEMLVESIAMQMEVELFRHAIAADALSFRGGLAPWQLRRIDERLNEVREAPTLRELAALCKVSTRHLSRAFRLSRGCSVGAFVARSQIEHAKQLLASGETVTAIAERLGFASSSNFCYAFRRVMGMTPGQFRQTLLRH